MNLAQKILKFFSLWRPKRFELIDNLDFFVKDKLNLMLFKADFLNIATGYFNISGWELFAQRVEKLVERGGSVRLIIGNVSKEELSEATAKLLFRLIENPKIQARTVKPRRLHSKLFLAGNKKRVSILFGSSNVTYGGLVDNIELNTFDSVSSKDTRAKSFIEWFEKIWEEAQPIDIELRDVIIEVAKPKKPLYYHLLLTSLILDDIKRLDLHDIGNFYPFTFQEEDATALMTRFLIHPGEPRGWFIAHEVGLGKTLIAGMGLKSLLSSGLIKRVLAIVPYSIQRQWREELRLRLDTNFNILTGDKIHKKIFNEGLYLVSYDLLRERVEEFPEKWDLIILDESHFIRNRETKRWKAVNKLKSSFWILLTATPMHNRLEDLLSQLSLFVPDSILKKGTRREVSHVDRTRLFKTFVHRRLQKEALRDILSHRHIKEPNIVKLSEDEDELYSALKKFLGETSNYYKIISRSIRYIIPFIKQIYLEEFTSSKEALLSGLKNLRRSIEDAINRKIIEYNLGSIREGTEDTITEEIKTFMEDELETKGNLEFYRDEKGNAIFRLSLDDTLISSLEEDIKFIDELVKKAKMGKDHSKVKETLDLIKALSPSSENKVVVFVKFIETGKLLIKALRDVGIHPKKFTDEDEEVMKEWFHGELEDIQREKLLERFRLTKGEDRIDVLVATDAAYVGLNLQVANFVVHHDLAWNPMVIEQRIGRVHRIGQKKDVASFSFLCKDTIDERKHEILGKKTEEIATHLGLSHDIVKKQVSILSDFQALVASLELGEITREEFEKHYEKLITDRKEILELFQNLTETKALLPQLGETQELLPSISEMVKELLYIKGEEIKANLTSLPENREIFYFEYNLNGDQLRELATFSPEVFIKGLEENLVLLEKYKNKISPERKSIYAITPFHPAIRHLVGVIKKNHTGSYKRIIESFPISCLLEFPQSESLFQLNYLAEIELENVTAGLKNRFNILIPLIFSSKDGKAIISAKLAYELANQKVIQEEKLSEFDASSHQPIIDQELAKFKDKLDTIVSKVKLEIGEVEASKKAYEIEKQLEELTKKLERVVNDKVRKKSQGLPVLKEETEEKEIKEKIKGLRVLKERGEQLDILVNIKNINLAGSCNYSKE